MKRLLFILFLLPTFTECFVSNYELQSPSGQKLVILGDAHRKEIDSLNKYHIEVFIEFIKHLESNLEEGETKLNVVYELEERFIDTISHSDENVALTIRYLNDFVKSYRANFFKFRAYDARGTFSELLNSLSANLEAMIFSNSSERQKMQHIIYTSLCEHRDDITVGQYFEFFKEEFKKIMFCRDNWKQNSKEYETLNVTVEVFRKAQSQLEKLFRNYEKNESLFKSIISITEKELSHFSYAAAIQLIFDLICRETDFVLADACYLNQIFKGNIDLLICGEAHAKNLLNLLTKMGYIVLSQDVNYIEKMLPPEKGGKITLIRPNDSMVESFCHSIAWLFY
ncbi:hypothetical protein KAW80_04625 [Candidatus Babeliales bacterium]|nr:hypothetical protein [Candidatus Babeliales bacterium]